MNRPAILVGVSIVALSLYACRTTPPHPTPTTTAISVSSAPVSGVSLVRLDPSAYPPFDDDGDTTSLRTAALQSQAYFQTLPDDRLFRVGSDTYTAKEMADSMASLVSLIDASPSHDAFVQGLRNMFAVYQSVGTDPERTVTFSSYYEPTISARLKKDASYRYPLYARPADLVDVDLGLFNPAYQGAKVAGRRLGPNLVPYYTRAQIDSEGVLKGRGLELAYTKDPLDIFFLQTEGSGWLDVGDRSIRIRYNGNNGKKYRSVGQYLTSSGRVPASGFGHAEFQRFMSAHPKERQSILNVNERYIFFQLDQTSTSVHAYGNIEQPLTPWRSVATDPKIFPKGALIWVTIGERPDSAASKAPHLWEPVPGTAVVKRGGSQTIRRFMLNQDEGGAIQGPGRVDFFAGHGAEAEDFATHLWHPGRLYFLVKKKS